MLYFLTEFNLSRSDDSSVIGHKKANFVPRFGEIVMNHI